MVLVVLVVLVVVVFGADARDTTRPVGRWTIEVSVDEHGATPLTTRGALPLTLDIRPTTVTWHACNDVGAKATITDSTIVLTNLVSTAMDCSGDAAASAVGAVMT